MNEDMKPRVTLSAEKRVLLELLIKKKRGASAEQQSIRRMVDTGTHPLSFEQERLWFLHLLNPASLMHHLNRISILDGPLDVRALQKSFDEIVRRHEILRTTIALAGESAIQVIASPQRGTLTIVDLRSLPEEEKNNRADQLALEQAREPFDLAQGPLMRATLLRLQDDKNTLLLTFHHIITDWWSFGVFYRELSILYRSFSTGVTSPLAELPIQYGDFARWQRERLQGKEVDQLLSYWKKQLSGCTHLLNLPTDRPRPVKQTFQGRRIHFEFSKGLFLVLEKLGHAEDVTAFVTSLAVFQVLLHRYTGQQDILVGSPSANRSKLETEGLIGFLLNTLVLRGDFSGDPTFRELLRRLRETVIGAYKHQDLPFQRLVEEVQTERNLGAMPLVQTCFIFLAGQAPNLDAAIPQLSEPDFPGLSVHLTNVNVIASEFDLTLTLENRRDCLDGFFEYNTELFEESTVSRMVGHLRTLMEAVVANPDQRISELRLLTEEERKSLLPTGDEIPKTIATRPLHELFEAQAARTPDAVAVVSDNEAFIYSELNGRANQMARHLRQLGVRTDARVAILLKHSVEMIVGLLAILKAGGAYVPLDPDYPRERLRFMLDDCGATVLLTDSQLVETLPGCSGTVVCIDTDEEAIFQQSEDNLGVGASPENLAYVIYTSGSTGQPKGAMLPHTGVVNCIGWMQETYRLTAEDRFLCKTSLNFDASVWEIFWPLTVGASLMVARHEGQRDGAYLAKSILRHGVTVTYFVPSMLALFIEEPLLAEAISVRKVICGGESLVAETVRHFYRRLPWAELHHSYGPTETSIAAAEFVCSREEDGRQVIPLGGPLGNNQLYILDKQMEAVPFGVTGELYIGGTSLARGYHGLPSLTAEKFIPNPFSMEPGARLYRTGDLMRYLPDGLLEFRGRTDSQIKLRGMRIELGEIEAALREHPGVDECVVVLRGEDREAALMAYVIPVAGVGPGAEELRSYLAARLPRHMVPSAFVTLEQLPLMVNGKVDRHALPEPLPNARAVSATKFVAPATELERTIAGIWSEVLGREEIGTQDNFFDLGGHSLRLLLVHLRLREAIGVEIPLFELFQYPTVSTLAAHLHQGADLESLDSSKERGDRRKKSVSQRRMRRDKAMAEANQRR